MVAVLVLGAVGLLLGACAELPAVEPGVCGNQVIEVATEDCDGLPDPAHGPGLTCERCRYLCDPGVVAPACPPGWGCGRDGTCRHGTGRFLVASGVPAAFPATALAAGDQDGDGADELFGTEPGRFIVLTAPARQIDQREFAGLGGVAVDSADLDGDGLAELVRPTRSGVYGLTGVPGAGQRAMLAITALDGEPGIDGVQPVEASSQAVVIGLDSAPDEPVPAALIGGPSPRWLSLGRLRRKVQFSAAGLTDLLPPVVVNLDPDPARAGHEIIIGARGGTALHQLRFDDSAGIEIEPIPIDLPIGATLAGPPLLVDHGGGKLDLLVPLESGRVARALLGSPDNGLRNFQPAAFDPMFAGMDPPRCGVMPGVPNIGAAPLAVADLDGDGDVDYVTPAGLVRTDGATHCLAVATSGTGAIAAAVLDAAGDGYLDVAWITADDSAVWLASNDGSGTYVSR
nr:hypothetical protein [Kofleriaceae bacterium]